MSAANGRDLSPLKRALVELRTQRARIEELEAARREPIAVIGLGCRLPGADGPDAFWRLLRDGVDAVGETPRDRWDVEAWYDPDPDAPGKLSTRWGGFLDGIDLFDPEAFGITPREADGMDPQQRLLLEVAWEALEHAGQAPDRLAGSRTGVFVGISTNDYLELRLKRGEAASIDGHLATGNARSIASGRLSYLLGLRGPSVSIDTACSSSLVAVHLAARSLRSGECELALAGGVNLMLLPELTMALSKARMMAADGRCKAFDASADGFVRSEGCGVVVLKRLADASADGDDVLAVIRGTAVNQDGRTSVLTAPSGPSQEEVIRDALADAALAPAEVDYVEAHGTGTSLGDPIEAHALAAVYGEGRPAGQPLAIGSVKTNLGHLEAAAGVAGLAKAVLALRHGEIPPHLHLRELNPYVPWSELPLTVPVERTPWPAGRAVRRAAVSSFGFGGTNAHVVLEQAAPPRPRSGELPDRARHLLCLSAHDDPALRELAGRFDRHLAEHPELSLAEICATASAGRARLTHRLALAVEPARGAEAVDDLRRRLAAAAAGAEASGLVRGVVERGDRPSVAFLFTGQGSQYAGMGRMLDETEPAYREALDRCDAIVAPRLGCSLRSILYADAERESLAHTASSHPALFALQYGLAELWHSWGVEPAVVLGHSVGEYAAACVAGVLELEDALELVTTRGLLTASLDGVMAVAFAGEERVEAVIAGSGTAVSIAAVNGPDSVVFSGGRADVETVAELLREGGVETRALHVSYASHSALVEPVLDTFEEAAARVALSPPRIPFVSCLTGELASDELRSAGYWRRHLREPVRFSAAVGALARLAPAVMLELGPKPVLLGMGRRAWPREVPEGVWLASLRREVEDDEQMLETLARLYVRGVSVDLEALEGGRTPRRVPLPTYPWQRRRHWLEGLEPESQPALTSTSTPQPEPRSEALAAASDGAPRLAEAADGEQRLEWLVDLLRRRVREVIRRDASRPLGRRDRLMKIGVDSLMAVELAAQLTRDLEQTDPLPATLVFDHPTIEALARHLDGLTRPERPTASPAAAPGEPVRLDDLSDSEVEALIVRKLEKGAR